MRIFEITDSESKLAKKAWADPEFQDEYAANNIRGDIKNSLKSFQATPKKEREKTWPTSIWNALSKNERDHLQQHSQDIYGDKDIHKTLEKVIMMSDPLSRNILSYRGLQLTRTKINTMIKKLDRNRTITFKNKHPSSFTNDANAAWRFSKSWKRANRINTKEELVPILLEILIPSGIKVGKIGLHHGIGDEHIVSASTSIKITQYKKYRGGFKFSGRLI